MPFTGSGTGIRNADDTFFGSMAADDSIRYNASTAKWNNIPLANSVTTAALATASVTEAKLAVSNVPATNQVLSWDGTAMTWVAFSQSSAGSQSFTYSGTLQVGTGVNRLFNDSGLDRTITSVRASVGTAPTGAAVIVDVKVAGVTIFATTADRPTINANQLVATLAVTTSTWTNAKAITVDIAQIGSTQPGADLTVTVEYR